MVFAGAATAYGNQKYDQFCFLAASLSNWGIDNKLIARISYLDKIMRMIGLTVKQISRSSDIDLPSVVMEYIDKGIPVLIQVKDNALFYSPNYRKVPDDYQHYIVVSDYDSERAIFIIRDNEQLYNVFNHLVDNDNAGLFKLQITASMFRDICENMVEICVLKEDKASACVSSDADLLTVLLSLLRSAFHTDSNRLVDFIKNIDNLYKTSEFSIQSYYGSVLVVFTVIETICANVGVNLGNDYTEFKKIYLNKRYEVILRINIERSKGNKISQALKTKLICNTYRNDELLHAQILQIYKALSA